MFTTFLRQQRVPFLLVILLLALHLLPQAIANGLEFNHAAIRDGQWWRLLTGHLLHTNHWHLLMNLGGLALIVLLHGMYYSGRALLVLLVIANAFIGLALLFFSPEIQLYRGLSGFLHALLICGCLIDIQRHLSSGWLILVGVFAKVIWEQMQGPSQEIAGLIGAEVGIDAHLYGALTGLLLFVGWSMLQPSPNDLKNQANATADNHGNNHENNHIKKHINSSSHDEPMTRSR